MINIFIVNWNSGINCLELIKSIFQSHYNLFRIIIVDNYSKDEDKIYLEECRFLSNLNKKEIYIIYNSVNLGYTGGNNIAYEFITKNKLNGNILILNPDILTQKNTLLELNRAINLKNVGGVMVRTKNHNGELLYDYIKLKGLIQKWCKYKSDDIISTDYLAGSCMLLKRELIDKIGLFDNIFFMYWEEVDLSIRIKECNVKLISTSHTFILRNKNDKSRTANSVFYLAKNPFILYDKYISINFLHLFTYQIYLFSFCLLSSITSFNFNYITKYFKGLKQGINYINK